MDVMQSIRQNRIIAILRGMRQEEMTALGSALYTGGIRMMEVTFDPSAPESFADTARAIRELGGAMPSDMLVGAGTVLNADQLHRAADAGARYIISPNVNLSVIAETKRLGLVSLPGALAPTEIVTAFDAGADAVKVFPASSMGADYLRALRGPLPHIPLLAVGGVNEMNLAEFLRAGAIGAGVGGQLVSRSLVEAGAFDQITALAARFVRAAQSA